MLVRHRDQLDITNNIIPTHLHPTSYSWLRVRQKRPITKTLGTNFIFIYLFDLSLQNTHDIDIFIENQIFNFLMFRRVILPSNIPKSNFNSHWDTKKKKNKTQQKAKPQPTTTWDTFSSSSGCWYLC